MIVRKQLQSGAETSLPIEHDAHGWPTFDVPYGQGRVVRRRRARADHHSIHGGPPVVHEPSRGLARNPSGFATLPGNSAVECLRHFQNDERPSGLHVPDEGLVKTTAVVLEDALGHFNPVVAKVPDPPTIHGRVRIAHTHDDAWDFLRKNRVRAGRRFSMVHTRLQVHVECGMLERIGTVAPVGILDRVVLGMGSAVLAMPSLAEQRAVGADEHGADHRIRTHASSAPLGQIEAEPHPLIM